MNNKPIKTCRAGSISATIWENKKDEQVYKTVDLCRSYKDKDGNWKTTSLVRVTDLPKVILVANEAYKYLTMDKGESNE